MHNAQRYSIVSDRLFFICGVFVGMLLATLFFSAGDVLAQSSEIDELRSEINNRNDRLEELQAEINQYSAQLDEVGQEKKTLQNAIYELDLSRKKVSTDITITQNKIGTTDLEISQLGIEIDEARILIGQNESALGETLQRIHETDNDSFVEILLRNDNISEVWEQVDAIEQFQSVVRTETQKLSALKSALEQKRALTQEKRGELVDLNNQYTGQRRSLDSNINEKDQLLDRTKSEEAEYQALLNEKVAAREKILKELRDFEAKLQFALDPSTIPAAGTQVFDWPLDNVRITQYFGGTDFAKANKSIYAGRAYHPGIDFGAPRGTPIKAPLAGQVTATGNTDATAGCYSWGKWILLRHANGLSTLYAHNSAINVVPGQNVSTGEVIAYSGNTGYSTGPHLHFSVYATAGVSVRRFEEIKAVTNCAGATTPVAATDAYIDPLLYLPPV